MLRVSIASGANKKIAHRPVGSAGSKADRDPFRPGQGSASLCYIKGGADY
jgi:hypothetical protein